MSQTQGFSIESCTFGSTPVPGATSISIRERSEPLNIRGDDDLWPRLTASRIGAVEWTLDFVDFDAARAAQTQMSASPAILTVQASDASGADASRTINIANAVAVGRVSNLRHNRRTTFSVHGLAHSTDGATNPVSY